MKTTQSSFWKIVREIGKDGIKKDNKTEILRKIALSVEILKKVKEKRANGREKEVDIFLIK